MDTETICLGEIAHARSGDKGNHANVAVLADRQEGFRWLQAILTTERVGAYFKGLGATRIMRYEAEKLLAFNFVLENALGGGAQSIAADGHAGGKPWPRQSLLAMRLCPAPTTSRPWCERDKRCGYEWGRTSNV